MSIESLKEIIPDYAKDLKLNLSTLSRSDELTEQQLWGTFLVSALASGNETVISFMMNETKTILSDEAMNAVKAANAIMGMNNIYYRFLSLVSDDSYSTMPAKLRMNIISNPGIEKADFELWSIAVSAINGCQKCVVAHEKQLINEGFTKDQILTAVRIASVVHGISSVISSETESANLVSRAA